MFTRRLRHQTMRKLNELYRALSAFLADPAGHVADAWSTLKGAISPEALNADSLTKGRPLKNAITVIDNTVSAVVYFLKLEAGEPKQPELDGRGEGG